MNRPDHYASPVATARPTASARVLADLMEHRALGCVVICDTDRRPVGIVTDRDLATRVVARGIDASKVTAAQIASQPVVVAGSDETIEEVVTRMRDRGLRRLPVVRDGALVGFVSLDDLVVQLSRELGSLATAAQLEIDASRRAGRRKRRREELVDSLASIEAGVLTLGKDAAAFLAHELETMRDRLKRKS